jgi:thymidine phosphorylase
MRRVVEREGGCVIWGGAVRLSPADDVLIRVERPLDFDSDGQLVASVLSKKAAAGATHVVLDVPVGPTAKVRSLEAAAALTERLMHIGRALDLELRIVPTDGSQPVGRGIGPALEARDVLAVLQGMPDAPSDLRERALLLAGHVLELCAATMPGEGVRAAAQALASGSAWRKFQAICEAQGGMRRPPSAAHTRAIAADRAGTVAGFDNRRLAKTAKLAGAPRDAVAGMDLHVRLGDRVERGQPLLTLHAAARGELEYALAYFSAQAGVITLAEQ